ncbi:hypothetical protein JK359_03665 [Streptomyces actinomycinicus]|uniref:asparagine synthase (glutamine-hydrolyzing) n=1 Tax=Streptomyces actinomycinicus TaxID=1695166 RepID=A0A937EDS8_9ACTN|nr:asparagine synthase-related protein [Streptomyces actinomycinicus]MBL1081078.1 hypothetical protein [Streptomyces actinomycinicus]
MIGRTWLLVVPDTEGGACAAAPLVHRARHVLRHASGRPWVLGCWPDADAVVATAGAARIAVIGRSAVTAAGLEPSLAAMRRASDADTVAGRLPGSFHLVTSFAGQVRVQGTIAQTRRVFYACVGSATLAADQADVLSQLLDSDVDEAVLATRLTVPPVPPPLAGCSPWRGVHAVAGDSYLCLDTDGSIRVTRWWRPPVPHAPLDEAAQGVRQALLTAVAVRSRAGSSFSADLSGGLDSTSLCFLVAAQGVPLVTFRHEAADPANDDARWAQQAAAALPNASHTVVGQGRLPEKYAGLDAYGTDPEEPLDWVRSRAALAAIGRRVASTGARFHLAGHGGDEIFTLPPSYLHTLIQTHPWEAVRRLRGHQAVRRWPTGAMVRSLADRDDYSRWLSRQADRLAGPGLSRTTPYLSWGAPSRMPPWATAKAVELSRTLMRQTAEAGPLPLAPLRAHHQILHHAAVCGRQVRLVGRTFAAAGSGLEVPYLDDRVIEAVLSTLLHHHAVTRRYKPLLATAMDGIVPAPLLRRATKGEFSADTYPGLRRHRARLLQLTEDSLLARRGLIDPQALRTAVSATYPDPDPLWHLDMTLACELWLRVQSAAPHDHIARSAAAHRSPGGSA